MVRLLLLSALAATTATAQPVPDSSFGGGLVTLLPAPSRVLDVHPTTSGRAVAVGYEGGGGAGYKAFAARLNDDGTLDGTFGLGGFAPVPGPPGREGTQTASSYVALAAPAREGRLFVASRVLYVRPPSHDYQTDVALFRLTSDGTPDSTFGTGGAVRLAVPGDTRYLSFCCLTATDDGGVIAGLKPTLSGSVLVKVGPTGAPDTTFGDGGQIHLPSATVEDLAVRADGRLLVVATAGHTYPFGNGALLAQFLHDGTPDVSFGDAGRVVMGPAGERTAVSGVALGAGGIAIVGGAIVENDGRYGAAVFRVHPDGTLDLTFGSDGVVWTDVVPASDSLAGIEGASRPYVRPDGGVGLVGGIGYEPGPITLVGYDEDGTPTEANGPGGVRVVFGAPSRFEVGSVRGNGTGAVYVAGSRAGPGQEGAAFVARLLDRGHQTGAVTPPSRDTRLAVAPNPAAETTHVTLTLHAPGAVHLTVVDALGRAVAALADGDRAAGTHTFALDAGRLAPGVYAVVAETAAGRAVTRVSVVR